MPVKGSWFYFGLAAVCIGLMDSLLMRFGMAAVWILVFRRLFTVRNRRFGYTVLALMLMLSIPLKDDSFHRGRLVAIKNNYQIVQSGLRRVIVYGGADGAAIDDIISLQDADMTPVSSYNNFEPATFESWAHSQNIYYTTSLDAYQIVARPFSLRRLLWQKSLQYGNGWINQLLWGSGMELSGDYSWLFTAGGMHVYWLMLLLKKVLQRFYYPDRALRITLNTAVILLIINGFSYSFQRVVVFLAADLFFDNKRDSWGFKALLLALLVPYGIKSAGYLLPVGIGLLNLFIRSFRRGIMLVYITAVQLYLNATVNLAAVLLFGMCRTLAGLSYLAAVAAVLLPVNIPLGVFFEQTAAWLDGLPEICINGRLPLLFLIAITILLLLFTADRRFSRAVMIGGLLAAVLLQRRLTPFYTVTMLDVGQGDCSVITSPLPDRAVLIDTGGSHYKDVAADIVIPFLKANAIKTVDIIISHDDYDHNGALARLEEEFEVDSVYTAKAAEIVINGIDFTDPLADISYQDGNDNSQISFFKLGGYTFLYLGDISSRVEQDLMSRYGNLQADFVKLAHHGSATASSDALLAGLHCRLALISAGRNNYYGHPAKAVTDRLSGYHIESLNTQTDHAIRFIVFNHFLIYQTASGLIGFCRAR